MTTESLTCSPSVAPAAEAAEAAALLSVRDLRVAFGRGDRASAVVRGVSFDIAPGETLVLLGESGSGKSVTSRAIMRLYGASARIDGTIDLDGRALSGLTQRQMRDVRGDEIGMVPQDPSGALDPLRRVGSQLTEVLRRHRAVDGRAAARTRALELLSKVGIPDPPRVLKALPHELSGGLRQRVVIALGIACNPRLLIADEPTTALDVTVQAQVLELFGALRDELRMGLLMVTHDVGVAREIADRVAVMYAGSIVESGPAAEVLDHPLHPYTAGLLAALPRPGVPRGRLVAIPGRPPAMGEIPDVGCPFANRCPHAIDTCRTQTPPLLSIGGRATACPVVEAYRTPPTAPPGARPTAPSAVPSPASSSDAHEPAGPTDGTPNGDPA